MVPHDSKRDLPLNAKDSFILVFLLLKKSLLNHVDFFSASMVFFKYFAKYSLGKLDVILTNFFGQTDGMFVYMGIGRRVSVTAPSSLYLRESKI